MNDKDFHKMDETWMKKTQPIREKEVSDGMLKGFSASVERRVEARRGDPAGRPYTGPGAAFRPAWAPMLAVLVLASVVVLRSPVVPNTYLNSTGSSMELAQAISEEEQLQQEVEVLQELGVWEESEEDILEDTA